MILCVPGRRAPRRFVYESEEYMSREPKPELPHRPAERSRVAGDKRGERPVSQVPAAAPLVAAARLAVPECRFGGAVLSQESASEYESFHASYYARFQPADLVEALQVEAMARAQWQIRRLNLIETTLLNLEIERLKPQLEETGVNSSAALQLSAAYTSLNNDSGTGRSIQRHCSALEREYSTALRELQILQSSRRQNEASA